MTQYKISYFNSYYKLYLYLTVRSVINILILIFKKIIKRFASNVQVTRK